MRLRRPLRRPELRFAPELAAVRRWSPVAVLLRLLLLGTGGAALAIAPAGRFGGPGVVALVGVLGLLGALAQPHGVGPAIVLGAATLSWVVRYGTDAPPIGRTMLLATLLVVHHHAAALGAALPVTARVDRRVLVRFGTHLALVLALSGLLAVLALGVARPGGSVPLELTGLAAAVLATAVLVGLGRVRPPPGR